MANDTGLVIALGLGLWALSKGTAGNGSQGGTSEGFSNNGVGYDTQQEKTLKQPGNMAQIGYSDAFVQQAARSFEEAGIKEITTIPGISGRTNIATAGITESEIAQMNKILPTKSLKSSGRSNREVFEVGGKTYQTEVTATTSKRGADGLTDFERATTGKRARAI